jgi:hypothetical protein
MPSSPSSGTAYYDMYSGKSGTDGSFNFCWYNVNDAVINQNVNMSIHSSSIVLTIGPETEEVVGIKNNGSSGTYATSSIGNTGFNAGTTKQASNTIVGEKNSSFWLKPYWNESSATIIVKSNFTVKYDSNGDGNYDKSYDVEAGEYTINNANGINLFSDAGETLLSDGAGVNISAQDTSVGWVDSDGTIINFYGSSPAAKEDDGVSFAATAGSLSQGAVYEAKSITARFTGFTSEDNPLQTNNATLKAQYISIGSGDESGTLYIQGTNFNINSYSGNIDYDDFQKGTKDVVFYELDESGKQVYGIMLQVASTVTLINDNQNFTCTLDPGYYFFANYDSVNILDSAVWYNGVYYYKNDTDFENEIQGKLMDLSSVSVINTDEDGSITFKAGKLIYWKEVTKVEFSGSRYY